MPDPPETRHTMPRRHFPPRAGTPAPTDSAPLARVAPTPAHMLLLSDGSDAGTGFASAGDLARVIPAPPMPGMALTLDYVPARDGLALLAGGPTPAGYAAAAAADPGRLWTPRRHNAADPKGGTDIYSGCSQWEADPGYAWSNGFTPFALDADGNLRIRARATAGAGFAAGEIPTDPATGAAYTHVSGVLTTRNRFAQQGGWWEIEARVPGGRAIWPAIWLFPVAGQNPPEIDILEHVGGYDTAGKYRATIHPKAAPQNQITPDNGTALGAAFHRYAVFWDDKVLRFFVDGVQLNSIDIAGMPEFGQPFYLLLANQVGSTLAQWVPPPDGTTPSPSDLLIRSVRVWQTPGPVGIQVSATSYLDSLPVGGTVATLSATQHGGNTALAFAEIFDPDDVFAVSGNTLTLSRSVPAATQASHTFSVRVQDGWGRARERNFTMGVLTGTPVQANYFPAVAANDLGNAFWGKELLTAPAADTVLETAATGSHKLAAASMTRAAGVKSMTAWVDATPGLGRDWLELCLWDGTYGAAFAVAWFNVAAGTVGYSTGTGGFSAVSAFLAPMDAATGKARCGIKFTTDAATTGLQFQAILALGQDQDSYAGNTARGMKLTNFWLYNTGGAAGGL